MSTIGSLIDELLDLRDEKREFEEAAKNVAHKIADLEVQLIAMMDAEAITKSSGRRGSVSVSSSTRPTVDSWDDFYKFIHDNKMYHLLERRPSVTGCRELFETVGRIPGVVPFVQRRLNLLKTED